MTAPAWNADEAKALAGSTPVPSADRYKVVLLGEQSASKTDGVGSNPTDLAANSGRGPGGEATV